MRTAAQASSVPAWQGSVLMLPPLSLLRPAQTGAAPNDEFLQRIADRDRKKNELATLLSKRPGAAELSSRKILLPTEAQRAISVRTAAAAAADDVGRWWWWWRPRV